MWVRVPGIQRLFMQGDVIAPFSSLLPVVIVLFPAVLRVFE